MPYKSEKDRIAYAKKHYQQNKADYKNRARVFRSVSFQRNRDYVDRYLSNHPCVDCGYSDIRALEFDHITGDKHKNISDMVTNGCSIKKIKAEITKCEVRCANCHRLKTWHTIWEKSD